MPLEASSISYEYAPGTSLAHKALKEVSLCVSPGEITFIIGSTGSGKSTLLRELSGLLKPDAGTVTLDGSALNPGSVGIVFQQAESQLFADTVLSDIAFGPRNLGATEAEAFAKARAALEQVELDVDVFSDRSPFSLSGGQARRVAIAGVLAMELPYLLFDEPTAGLDGSGRKFVQRLIASLKQRGVGIVVVSHDIDEFLGKVDKVALLREGEIVWQGAAGEIIADPRLFDRAGLAVPDLLRFQQELACPQGGFSFDADIVATWALSGFPVGGPQGHVHAHVHQGDCPDCSSQGADGTHSLGGDV